MFRRITSSKPCIALALLLAATTITFGDESNNASESETGPNGFWLGIQAVSASDALKSHLRIDSGLLVEHLVPDAPGAKAGIERHDVLLKYNEEALNGIPDLVDAVAEFKGEEATVQLIRAGKEMTLKLTPAERPEGSVARIAIPSGDSAKNLREWLRGFEQGDGDTPLRFQWIRPGFAIPGRIERRMNLPEGMSICVTKENNGPAKIVVKKDGETWEATEDKLDELPEDVRPTVERFLGRGLSAQIDLSQNGREEWLKNLIPDEKTRKAMQEQFNRAIKVNPGQTWPNSPKILRSSDVEKQFDELRGELKRLHEKIDELHGQRSDKNDSGESNEN